MKKITLVALSAALLLSSCANDPYTGEEKVSKTAWGAGIGTVAGAGIGAIVGGEKGALIGGMIGGATGAGVGGYMDMQARDLRKELEGTGVRVVEKSGSINLIMPSNITFDTDIYTIKANFKPVLDSVSKVLQHYAKTSINVAGYTDSTGTLAHNQTLSLNRAKSVAMYLELRGIAQDRISYNGYGPSYPVASNTTAEGREQNRRVELRIVPLN